MRTARRTVSFSLNFMGSKGANAFSYSAAEKAAEERKGEGRADRHSARSEVEKLDMNDRTGG